MFNLHDFILKGLKKAIGKMADYQVMLNAVGWFEKGVLLESDLADIESLIDEGLSTDTTSAQIRAVEKSILDETEGTE